MRTTTAILPVGLLALALGAAHAGDPPVYTAKLITPGLDAINAASMNEAGDVVGTGNTGSGAWVSLAGAPAVLLPVPPGSPFAFANDINDLGVIVGSVSSTPQPNFGKAASWTPDGAGGYIIAELGTLPGHIRSDATAVNNLGDIIGYSGDGTFRFPVLFSAAGGGGGIQDLSFTGVFDPVDINDDRVLVDHSFTSKKLDLDTMMVQDLGVPEDAGALSYASSTGEVINEVGQVGGRVRLAISTSCDHEAARFTDGIGWEVLSNCGSINSVWDMNDLGDVVMRLNQHPFVRFEGLGAGGTFRIEDLIEAEVGHWFVINGFGITINNAREMAVPAHNEVTGEAGIILLMPKGPPGGFDGDVTGDGKVDSADLNMVLGQFGESGNGLRGDVDGDGLVGSSDLNTVLGAFGAGT